MKQRLFISLFGFWAIYIQSMIFPSLLEERLVPTTAPTTGAERCVSLDIDGTSLQQIGNTQLPELKDVLNTGLYD
jgi:hypothetical protein